MVVLAGKCLLIKSKNRKDISSIGIFIEVIEIIKRAKTLLLVFCKTVYVKVQQMDMKTGVNIVNMTSKVKA